MVGGGPPVRGNIFGGKRYGDAKRYGGKKDTEIGARLMAGKQDTERRKKDMAGDKRYGGSTTSTTQPNTMTWPPKPKPT